MTLKFDTDLTDLDGDRLLTFWIGVQGFTLRTGFEKDERGDERLEWYKRQLQNVFDNYAESYHKAKVESISVEDISNMFPKTNNASYVASNAIKKYKSELLK